MAVTTWPVAECDRGFLLDLYAANRAAELAVAGWEPAVLRAFLEQQYRAREAGWAAAVPGADDLLVVRDGSPIGRLVLLRRGDGIRVVDVALSPQEQGRGVGAALLRGILDEADAAHVPVTLHVVATSPARRLYERLGFRPEAGEHQADGVYVFMQRLPNPAAAQPKTAT